MSSNPLRVLHSLGQSVWFDYIRRRDLVSGHIKELIDNDGVSGITSNPSIFEKAIAGSNDYDVAIRKLVEAGVETPLVFESLEVEDIQMAADFFRPTYDSTEGRDGYVSIEVAPTLARDTQGTIKDARRLWSKVKRPNILVKVPGTAEGLPAIEQLEVALAGWEGTLLLVTHDRRLLEDVTLTATIEIPDPNAAGSRPVRSSTPGSTLPG